MELSADVPALFRDFDNLHEVSGGVDTHTLHAVRFVLVLIGIIELIAMTMTLLYRK